MFDTEVQWIDGAGHGGHMSHPGPFAAFVRRCYGYARRSDCDTTSVDADATAKCPFIVLAVVVWPELVGAAVATSGRFEGGAPRHARRDEHRRAQPRPKLRHTGRGSSTPTCARPRQGDRAQGRVQHHARRTRCDASTSTRPSTAALRVGHTGNPLGRASGARFKALFVKRPARIEVAIDHGKVRGRSPTHDPGTEDGCRKEPSLTLQGRRVRRGCRREGLRHRPATTCRHAARRGPPAARR